MLTPENSRQGARKSRDKVNIAQQRLRYAVMAT